MESVTFNPNNYKVIYVFVWSTSILTPLIIFLALTTKGNWRILPILSSILLITVFIGFLIKLYIGYSKDPLTVEKRSIEKATKAVAGELNQLVYAIKALDIQYKKIVEQHQKYSDDLNMAHINYLENIGKQHKMIEQKKEDYIDNQLKQIQESHFVSGLKSNLIISADIPGIGKVFKQKLINNGIVTAYDINSVKVQNIQGIGEKKTTDLVNWRWTIVSNLRRTEPKKLPNEQQFIINEHFKKMHQEWDENEAVENVKFNNKLEILDQKKEQLIYDNKKENNELVEKKIPVEENKYRLEAKLNQYRKINYFQYINGSLESFLGPYKSNSIALKAILFVIIVISFCISGTTFMFSTANVITDNLPTFTATVTRTKTVTNTETPSKTLTNTPSNTPTITDTVTPSYTPTSTPTPVATIPPIPEASCIPIDGYRQVAYVTNVIDGDSFIAQIGDRLVAVKMLGIIAPEFTYDNSVYYGQESAGTTRALIEGKYVTLVSDTPDPDLLPDMISSYVLWQNSFINYYILSSGFASIDNNEVCTCTSTYTDAVYFAKENLIGLYNPTKTSTPTYVIPTPYPYTAPVYDYGPTALCNDGTYSYSQNHRGTCSWHGGVAVWYK
jgi:hypothetical protein